MCCVQTLVESCHFSREDDVHTEEDRHDRRTLMEHWHRCRAASALCGPRFVLYICGVYYTLVHLRSPTTTLCTHANRQATLSYTTATRQETLEGRPSARLARECCVHKILASLFGENKWTGMSEKINYRNNCIERLQRGRGNVVRKHVKHWRLRLRFSSCTHRQCRSEYSLKAA